MSRLPSFESAFPSPPFENHLLPAPFEKGVGGISISSERQGGSDSLGSCATVTLSVWLTANG
jgi:hypothetical protein